MVWGFCYLRIFKKLHSISGRSLLLPTLSFSTVTTQHGCFTRDNSQRNVVEE
jgi:hypothetical protein